MASASEHHQIQMKETNFNDSFEDFFMGPASDGKKSAEMVEFTLEYFRKRPHLWKSDDSDSEDESKPTKRLNSIEDMNNNGKDKKNLKSVLDTTICKKAESSKTIERSKTPGKGYEFFKRHLQWKSKSEDKDHREKITHSMKTFDKLGRATEERNEYHGQRISESDREARSKLRSRSKSRIANYRDDSPVETVRYSSPRRQSKAALPAHYSKASEVEIKSRGRSKSRTTYAEIETPQSTRYTSPRRLNLETLGAHQSRSKSSEMKAETSRSRSKSRITSTMIESPDRHVPSSSSSRGTHGRDLVPSRSQLQHQIHDPNYGNMLVTPNPGTHDQARGSTMRAHISIHFQLQPSDPH